MMRILSLLALVINMSCSGLILLGGRQACQVEREDLAQKLAIDSIQTCFNLQKNSA